MYYEFSFCDNIAPYSTEIEALDNIIGNNNISVPSAKSMPFSFALCRNRKITAIFDNPKYYMMILAFLEEQSNFFKSVMSFVPFDDNFLNFALNNTKRMHPWQELTLFFLLNYYSAPLMSFDGPYLENLGREDLSKHFSHLSRIHKRKFQIYYNVTPKKDELLLYEFPNSDVSFREGSLIITNKIIENANLLFEDKLKIYGV